MPDTTTTIRFSDLVLNAALVRDSRDIRYLLAGGTRQMTHLCTALRAARRKVGAQHPYVEVVTLWFDRTKAIPERNIAGQWQQLGAVAILTHDGTVAA
jgi:hypothetical protein